MQTKNDTEWNTADLEALVKATGLQVTNLNVASIRGYGRRADRMDKIGFNIHTSTVSGTRLYLTMPSRARVESWVTPLEVMANPEGLTLPSQLTAWLYRELCEVKRTNSVSSSERVRGSTTLAGLPEAPVALRMPHKRKASKPTPASLEEAKAKLVTHTTRLLNLDQHFKYRLQALQAEYDKERAKVEKRISAAQKQIDKATRRQERKNAHDGLMGKKEGA